MVESRRVCVGLDVHARSIRLAAIRGDELLVERTFGYDEERLERVLGEWAGVRCCYEAGPTGFGSAPWLIDFLSLRLCLRERRVDRAEAAPEGVS